MNIVYKTSSKIVRAHGNPVVMLKLSLPEIEEDGFSVFNLFYQRLPVEYEGVAKRISAFTHSVTDARMRNLSYIFVSSGATFSDGVIKVVRSEIFKIKDSERRVERVDMFDVKRGIFIK